MTTAVAEPETDSLASVASDDSTPEIAPADFPSDVADDVADQVRSTVETVLRRGLVGLEYISLDDPQPGSTPKDTILSEGSMKLYHYRPKTAEVYRLPLLVITSLVSKPYILDLTPGQSMVEFLVEQGYDVYLIDWGAPLPEESSLTLDDYALSRIPACIERIKQDSGESELNMLGYCLGGTLGMLYLATHPDAPVRHAACLTTPVNFKGMGLFTQWTDQRYFDVDRIVDTLGNVPGEMLLSAFDMLRPTGRLTSPIQVLDRIRDDKYVRSFMMVDRWAADQIPFAGEAFRQMIKELYWKNAMLEGTLELGGKRVDLRSIKLPIIHAMAEHDHVVPYAAAKPLLDAVGSEDTEAIVMRGGHASLVAGGNAKYRLWPKLDQWLSARSV